ncbi:hypothetical protein OG266_31640 [Streptomyces sp. NBC_00554]|uniref:hypothetical protein n=1 Tax=Streptomyces sp. NBC_00554 TaxID=2903661 RepID=UPI00352DFCFA|nr:hypothetical protein OG266_31640 [Streptomyces sp. NBC_00554]
MTACATEPGNGAAENENEPAARPACVITADGTYAARLALDGESQSWYPERWTLDGAEPYAVPLPAHQPEEPGTEVLPLTDGRVLIHREADGRHAFSLLYPTGPGTGELPLGAVECPDAGTRLRLLPPAPDGDRAYALAVGRGSTAVWLVAGGAFGPEHLAEVPGRCSGGVWLDGTGRLLALDRCQDGRTKTVVVDLERGGEVSPLLQIAENSNDRLLLADPDSGLLLIRSDAPSPGHDRLGWGVLGSTLPVRFPESLHPADCAVTPFAIQPGQVLMPENCAVALRIDGPSGTWVGLWRPSERQVHHLPAPEGWLTGAGLWNREGVLQLPYATGTVAYGVAKVQAPAAQPERSTPAPPEPERAATPRPVPLQQAPLTSRAALPPGPAPLPAHAATPPPRAATPPAHTATPPTSAATPPARPAPPPARPAPPPASPAPPPARAATPPDHPAPPLARPATPPARPAFEDEAVQADSGGLGAAAPRNGTGRGGGGEKSTPAETPALAPG